MPSCNVFYYRCPYHRLRHVLTMAVSFDKEDDVYQLALSYPYSYSRLKNRLNFYQILTSKCNEGSQYKFSNSSSSSSTSVSVGRVGANTSSVRKFPIGARNRIHSRHQQHPLQQQIFKQGIKRSGNENIHLVKGKVISSVKSNEDTGICFRRDRLSMRSLVSVWYFAFVFSLYPFHFGLNSKS